MEYQGREDGVPGARGWSTRGARIFNPRRWVSTQGGGLTVGPRVRLVLEVSGRGTLVQSLRGLEALKVGQWMWMWRWSVGGGLSWSSQSQGPVSSPPLPSPE